MANKDFPTIVKAARVIGDSIVFRNAMVNDAEFILSLRLDPERNKHLSKTSSSLHDQVEWLEKYAETCGQAYFIIEHENAPIGTVRLYDPRGDSFCWGSWILSEKRPRHAAVESALMVYSFAVDRLGFARSHFDVRRDNEKVCSFHEKFGARRTTESTQDIFYEMNQVAIRQVLAKMKHFLSNPVRVEWLEAAMAGTP